MTVFRFLTLISIAFFLSSCAITRPTRAVLKDKKEVSYISPINFEIEYEDLTGLDKTDPDYLNAKEEVEADLKRANMLSPTTDSAIKLKLTYFKCDFKSNYPTSSKGWNTLIAIVTLGFYPIGEDRSCKTDLQILNKSSGQVEKTLSYSFEAVTGGSLWIYGVPTWISAHKLRVVLPARVLINEYQRTLIPETAP